MTALTDRPTRRGSGQAGASRRRAALTTADFRLVIDRLDALTASEPPKTV